MKIAYTLWTWLMDEHNEWGPTSSNLKKNFEDSLREVSDLGFKYFEDFNLIVNLFEGADAEFDDLCAKYDMKFVNVYHYIKTDFEQDLAMAKKCCEFLNKHDANLMNLQAPFTTTPRGERPTPEELEETIIKVNKINEIAQDHGVTVCFHPHFGSTVHYEEDITRALEGFEPSVKICLDTAHTRLAGMKVYDKIREIGDRIAYVHLKDVCDSKDFALADQMFRFKVLGMGTIDFAEVFKALEDIKFDGFACFEQDYQRICNYETGLSARNYLHKIGRM
ncbi:sugar phosphate isomerase/epimerase [Chloroflexota bacterium]|nr:sugar phosphate isomerase/epimerase [Chloroflexota bacterium]